MKYLYFLICRIAHNSHTDTLTDQDDGNDDSTGRPRHRLSQPTLCALR